MGLARPVRRQRGTGHRGGAVLVPAAPHAEIDMNAPSARCAAAHFGVLVTTADRVAGAQCPLYGPSVALPVAVSAVPLFSHLGAELGPFLLDAGRAAAGPARPWHTPARWQVSPAGAPRLGAAVLIGVVRAMSSPPAGPAGVSGVSHMDMLCSSRASCRCSRCPRRGLGWDARGGINDVLDAPDALDTEGVVVDLVQRAHDLASQFVL